MYELNRLGEHTYYIDSPTNVGIYEYGGKVCLIDSGSDKDSAKKALKLISDAGWTLDMVICTHSHADLIGGCALLKER
ncbi:MAG: MBL fold metallo-hydrolase, partial [Oscillospiraceae bacterium]